MVSRKPIVMAPISLACSCGLTVNRLADYTLVPLRTNAAGRGPKPVPLDSSAAAVALMPPTRGQSWLLRLFAANDPQQLDIIRAGEVVRLYHREARADPLSINCPSSIIHHPSSHHSCVISFETFIALARPSSRHSSVIDSIRFDSTSVPRPSRDIDRDRDRDRDRYRRRERRRGH